MGKAPPFRTYIARWVFPVVLLAGVHSVAKGDHLPFAERVGIFFAAIPIVLLLIAAFWPLWRLSDVLAERSARKRSSKLPTTLD